MKLLLRFLSLRYRLQARYWKRRAFLAEKQLEAELWRNRGREDELITVPMRMAGLWGMPPRTEPAPIRRQIAPPALVRHADPWQDLNYLDKQEWEEAWWPDARLAGISEAQARQDFLSEIARRKTINEEPMM